MLAVREGSRSLIIPEDLGCCRNNETQQIPFYIAVTGGRRGVSLIITEGRDEEAIIITDDLECRDEEERNPTIHSTRHSYRYGREVSLIITERQTAYDMTYNS
jgi:hypothetical protein